MVMDVQRGVLARFADNRDYLRRLRGAIDKARQHGVAVTYVVVGFRPGHPEVSPRNLSFSAIASSGGFCANDPASQIHPDVEPQPGDVVVTKRRVSAFAGSDLDMVLRAGEFDHMVLTGVATSGVVLSTLRQAADLDFRLTVIADCCLDADAEVHRVLTEKIFPRQAEVLTAASWLSSGLHP